MNPRRLLCPLAVRALLLAGLGGFSAAPAQALVELELLAANDFGTFSPHPDDLYTASLGLRVSTPTLRFTLFEHMFTDRGAGVRFDETHVYVGHDLLSSSSWFVTADIGAVHVGEGLLGQDFQNWLHRLLNAKEASLDYVDDTGYHAAVHLDVRRSFEIGARLTVIPWVDLYSAFGFKQHVLVGGRADLELGARLELVGRLGARCTSTDLAELDPWVTGCAPAAAIGVRCAKRLSFSYSYNAFGTEDHHLELEIKWRFD